MAQWAGMGSGAADGLQEWLLQQFRQKQIEEEMKLRQQAQQQDGDHRQQQLMLQAENQRTNAENQRADNEYRSGQVARQGRMDRQETNQAEVRRMMGEYLRPRDGQSASQTDRETAGAMAFGEGVEMPAYLMAKPQRTAVTTTGPGGRPMRKTFTEDELAAGVPEYRAPTGATTPSTPQQEWVIRGNTTNPIPIPRGTAQAGDRPYDAVAARSSKPVNDEAVDTAREVSRLAGALRSSPGFGGVFGKFSSLVPQVVASQDTVDSRTLLNSLKGLLTIGNMGKMKGVLSDSDMRILQQASTTLDAPMSEQSAATELERLVDVMSRVASMSPIPNAGGDGDDALLDELLGGGR